MPFSRFRRLASESAALPCVLGFVLLAEAGGAAEIRPRVGVEFEHFGQEYHVTDDQDTVTTIDDAGIALGVTVENRALRSPRLRLDASLFAGRQADRARVAFQGEARRGANLFLFDQDASARRFRDDGDYSLSSDSFTEAARLAWERELDDATSVRLQDEIELVRYADPDEYNLSSFLHRPGVFVRRSFGFGSDLRAGYRLGLRDVPDSSLLDSTRHGGELDLGFFLGDRAFLDLSHRVDRRLYDDASPRESSWENRIDAALEPMGDRRVNARARTALEIVHFDGTDDLDFDFTRMRISAGPVFRVARDLEVALSPVAEHVFAKGVPAEEYTELGIELGMEWHRGGFWVSFTDEIGGRNYRVEANDDPIDPTSTDVLPENDGLYSDSLTNRLTLLVAADLTSKTTLRFFANWEPEDHELDRDDAASRIVSGGIEYRF